MVSGVRQPGGHGLETTYNLATLAWREANFKLERRLLWAILLRKGERVQNLAGSLVFVTLTVPMDYNPDPDADLMLRVKRGDHAAFTQLVEKYKQPVMNLVYRFLRDATEAEDLAQNVFVQVYKSASRYQVSARFSTWLFTITRNLCLNEIRRRSRHPTDSLDASANPEAEDQPARHPEDVKSPQPADALLQQELERKINEAVAELPETQRTAILLCRRDDMSYEDIAKVIGCSLSATKSLIHRGRETLKQKLKPYLRTGEWREERH
jgi:RNA polymerase sigma-70 factor (ECF subfamily)